MGKKEVTKGENLIPLSDNYFSTKFRLETPVEPNCSIFLYPEACAITEMTMKVYDKDEICKLYGCFISKQIII